MILQALYDYYRRLENDREQDIAPPGFSDQGIGFRVVINTDGTLHAVEPLAVDERGKPKPVKLRVPGLTKPSGSGINPCFLWDNATYLLGVPHPDHESKWAADRFEKLRERHLAVEKEINDPGYSAVCRFLEKWSPAQVQNHPSLTPPPTNFGVFQLRGQPGYVHKRPAVLAYWQHKLNNDASATQDDPVGVCSVTGISGQRLARLHEPKIKGLPGQTMGGLLVSFNDDAYESYGKTQSYNAPVSADVAVRYCHALNHLLADKSRRVIIGDATTVFWTEQPTPIERTWGPMLDNRCAESQAQLKEARELLIRIAHGSAPPQALGPPKTRFFVLGLSPNAGRIAVRFWLTDTLEALLANIREHLRDLEIVGFAPDAPPLLRELLRETVPPKKGWPDEDKIPPRLGGDLIRAVLQRTLYPESLFNAVLQRIRTERFIDPDKRKDWQIALVRRAAILKAHLNRLHRFRPFLQEAIPMALDPNRNDSPYVLGRLFATYEKIQRDGLGEKLNRTIKDSYLSSASASPAAVFPRLFRLSQHHLAKIDNTGLRITREKLLADLFGRIDTFPSYLSHHNQGLFAIGYYHQMQDFYTAKGDSPKADPILAPTTN